jgi:hypothetical protein
MLQVPFPKKKFDLSQISIHLIADTVHFHRAR